MKEIEIQVRNLQMTKVNLILSILISVHLTSCFSSAIFNQRAYEQVVSIKVDALSLMNKSNQPYNNYSKDVEFLLLNIEKAYEYAKGLPNNEETVAQWEIIKDTKENSIISFLERWEKEVKLNQAFIENSKKQIAKQFDQIIELESGKKR